MGKKAGSCCDTSPALEVLTGSVQPGLHWGFNEGEAEQNVLKPEEGIQVC